MPFCGFCGTVALVAELAEEALIGSPWPKRGPLLRAGLRHSGRIGFRPSSRERKRPRP